MLKIALVKQTALFKCAGLISLYLAFLSWHYMTAESITLSVSVWLFTLWILVFMAGDIFLKYVLDDRERFDNLSVRLLMGMLLVGVSMFVLILFLPFGPAVDWAILLVAMLFLWIKIRRGEMNAAFRCLKISESIFLLLVLIIITLWCQDLLSPIEIEGEMGIIRAWRDTYYHLSEINIFSSSRGGDSISDVQMAGVGAHIYHFASYTYAAAMVDATGSSALVAFSSLYVPLGILLSVLAAYSLTASVFGSWPAFAAGLALILLPDPSQQGYGIPYYSYHWLQQVAPAGTYGVASAAAAFMLILEGCRTQAIRLIFIGYLFVISTLLFKAQIFVAISFLALVYPSLFMKGLRIKYRLLLVLLLTGIFIGAVTASQNFHGVPVMRLDGSSLFDYSSSHLDSMSDNFQKEMLQDVFSEESDKWIVRAGIFATLLILWILGALAPLYLMVMKGLCKSFEKAVWLFPLLVMIVYLVMATSLAMDDRRVGQPEELLHRPFVWAYFVFVVWTSAAVYHKYFGNSQPQSMYARWLLIILLTLLLIIPAHFGKEIQTFKNWGEGYQELPVCKFEVAKYIKLNSKAEDIIQDSMNDPEFVLSGLSGRQSYAIDSGFRPPAGIRLRLQNLTALKDMKEKDEVESFMMRNSIKWYVVNPEDYVYWDDEKRISAVFECGGYRVYRF